MFEEEQRTATAVTQAKQYAWAKWNDIEPIKLSWKCLISMGPLVISFLLCSAYDILPNVTNLKLKGYTDLDLCFSCKSDQGTLCTVLSACPQSLQVCTWWHNKMLEVVIELLRAQCEVANKKTVSPKEPIIQFHKEGVYSVRKQKIPIWSYWMESFNESQDISTIFSSHCSNRKAARHCSMVWFKEECHPHRIHCSLERKPGGGTQVEDELIRETVCWLRGKGFDMLCDSYWGWLSWFSRTLSHFLSFKNRNHWLQFESCLISSSDHGAICIKLDLIESKKSSAWMKCMRNHHSHVIT